jgi:hypothetical protein
VCNAAADLKAELLTADSREPLDVAKDKAQFNKQKQMDTLAQKQKHENYKGEPHLRHKDYNHQQQPGGAMRGA